MNTLANTLLATALLGAVACAQARLVLDLNQASTGTESSDPERGFNIGADTWFVARTSTTGAELWHVDGSGAVTFAHDLEPGPASSSPHSMAAFQGGLVFAATRLGFRDLFLLRGPGQIPDNLTATATSLAPVRTTVAGSKIFFVGDDGVHGPELWVSRGVRGDARLVADIRPGSAGAGINALAAIGEVLVFLANDGQSGVEWWVSDGTAAGTFMLADLLPGAASGGVAVPPIVVAGRAYLPADDGSNGVELWTTDGSAGSLRLVADIVPGQNGSYPGAFAGLPDGRIVFAATSAAWGRELFASDGTTAGTQLLVDLYPGPGGSDPREAVATSRGVFFTADVPGLGRELFVSDGTVVGTRGIDVTPGPRGSLLESLTGASDRAYFAAIDETGQRDLMVSDGTQAGTIVLLPNAGSPNPLAAWNGRGALLSGATAAHGREPWLSDGSVAGTRLARDVETLRRTADANPVVIAPIGGRLLFSANDGTGPGLWITDGTAPRTIRLRTLATPSARLLARLSGRALIATDGLVLSTDGSAIGTYPLPVNAPIPTVSNGSTSALLSSESAVFAGLAGAAPAVFTSDGTTFGTRQIALVEASDFVAGSGVAYFVGFDPVREHELWRTDGTGVGTGLVIDLQRPGAPRPDLLGMAGGRIIFIANDGQGDGVFASDGTAAGTALLRRITARPSVAGEAVVVGNSLVFARGGPVFVTDGTVAGTTVLLAGDAATSLAPLGSRVLILRRSGVATLWTSDGTVAGTQAVPYPLPNSLAWQFQPISDNRVAFPVPVSADEGALLVTDGTALGTRAVANFGLTQGLAYLPFVAAGDQVYFADDDPHAGVELFAAGLGAVAQREGHGCGGSVFGFTLKSSEPRLGQTLRVSADSLLPATAVLIGAPGFLPTAIPNVPCAVWVDLARALVAVPIPAGGMFVPIPPTLELVGVRLMLQAFSGPSRGALGLDVSNGVSLRLGY